MRTKHFILSLILLSKISLAQGEAGSLFLSINPGARSNGMGEAQIGISNDAYATYYNPAGLTNRVICNCPTWTAPPPAASSAVTVPSLPTAMLIAC